MIPTLEDIKMLHQRYAINEEVYDLVYGHCTIVADIAKWCVEQQNLVADITLLEASCLLHDIGTYALFNTDAKVNNEHNYMQHAIFGAALVVEEGYDPRIADMIRTHVLMGLTKHEINENKLALPYKDFVPSTIEAEILCYADRFHSKRPVFNSYDTFVTRLANDLPEQAAKLKVSAQRFGIPNIEQLAKKYNQPTR